MFSHSVTSLKQQSTSRHVTPLTHYYDFAIKSVLLLLNTVCLMEKQQLPIL